jgi:hypothetical protein
LEFSFVGNCPARELNTNTAERLVRFEASSPNGITIRHCYQCVMIGSVVEEKVVPVAINRWQGAFREVESGTSLPKVDSISLGHVEVANCVFQSVVVVFSWGRIRLQEFNARKCNVGIACSHCPDEFANATSIFDLHIQCQFGLFGSVSWASGSVEFLGPCNQTEGELACSQ